MSPLGVTIFLNKASNEFYDRNDQSLKVAIASYTLEGDSEMVDRKVNTYMAHIKLNLNDFSVPVSYVLEDGTKIEMHRDGKSDVVALAAESVLKALHKENCVGKDIVSYQSRYEFGNVSGLSYILLEKRESYKYDLNEGIIKHAYAYLNEHKLCLFLNKTSAETLAKIDAVLAKLFPKP